MRRLIALLAIVAVACLTSPAEASLSVGDRIRFTDQVGTTGGGEFGVHLKDHANPFDGNGESGELFRTFCLERNEFLDFHPNGFLIDSISKEAVAGGAGGPNPDPISPETAWLFYNFTLGTLSGYLGDVASANDLQNAIWGYEEEIAQDAAWSSNAFVIAANAAAEADKAAALARTFVLNIVWASDRHGFDGVYEGPKPGTLTPGDRAQSVLYVNVIPEASTLAVWSILATMGLCIGYRKRTATA